MLAASAVLAPALSPSSAEARQPVNPPGIATVRVDQLPDEAAHTILLIRSGGPFPYSKDGVVFSNRERLLPARQRGFYREYTVKTVGARDRGARRIVCGGNNVKLPEACFYTDDHYASFRIISK